MIAFICRARKHVGNAAAQDRSDDAERDRPEERYVHVHDVFRDNPRDEANQKVPDQVKHVFFPPFAFGASSSICPGSAISPEFALGDFWPCSLESLGCAYCSLLRSLRNFMVRRQ